MFQLQEGWFINFAHVYLRKIMSKITESTLDFETSAKENYITCNSSGLIVWPKI